MANLSPEPEARRVPEPRTRRLLRRFVPLWLAGVGIGSFLPGSWKLAIGTRPYTQSHFVDPQHRVLHIVTFGFTALLLMLLFDRARDRAKAAFGALLFGGAIETMQFATGLAAVFEWWDLRDDFFGIAATWAAVELVSGRIRLRRK